jgi:multiple sugar transport system permease protein
LRKGETTLGFLLHLIEQIARREKVRVQVAAAIPRKSEVTGLVRRLERATYQITASQIEHAARIDGCGRLRALWQVTIPMAAPGIAAAFVIAFLTAWNELLFAIVLTGGTAKQTLSPALLAFSPAMASTGAANLGITPFAAGSVLSTLPPLILALLVQRYIRRLNVADR